MVDWAKELGIDIGKLCAEHPTHGSQVRQAKEADAASKSYWATERFLAQIFDQPVGTEQPAKKKRAPKYKFTDAQMKIAMDSFDNG